MTYQLEKQLQEHLDCQHLENKKEHENIWMRLSEKVMQINQNQIIKLSEAITHKTPLKKEGRKHERNKNH